MNKGLILGGAVMAAAVASAFVTSGLNKGERVSPFHPKHVAGALKGTDTCFPCTYQNRPQVQAWVTDGDHKSVHAFAATLDKAMSKYANKEFKAMVVIVAPEAQSKTIEAAAPQLNKEFKHVSISYLSPSNPAVKAYKINTAAKNTIVSYKNWVVADKLVDVKADEAGLASLAKIADAIVK
ncbi:MAG TPA: hypothetical protein VK171_15610 [Fimbriimonas sp.]|nr:hypothetical protein [Fimbriimonas sp.]